MLSISVVIPNYNGQALLERNLPFVFEALDSSGIQDFEVIVSDDASSDNSVAFLSQNYPEVKCLINSINKGFASNANAGIFAAKKDLILLLNTDVQLTPNYFTHQLPHFEAPDTFGVMGRIIALTNNDHQDGAKLADYHFGKIGTTKNYVSETVPILYSWFLSGANALLCRKKVQEMGGFNTLFDPYYYEDAELGIRAWRSGYKLYYEDRAVCRHPNSITIAKEPSEKVKVIVKRNKILLHYMHLEGTERYFFMWKTLLKSIFRWVLGQTDYWRGFRAFQQIKADPNTDFPFSVREAASRVRSGMPKDCRVW